MDLTFQWRRRRMRTLRIKNKDTKLGGFVIDEMILDNA
jgi:hypothetical protein